MSLKDTLSCNICHGLLKGAVSAECGHSFCSGCVKYLRMKHQQCPCPICNHEPFVTTTNISLQWAVDAFQLTMPKITQTDLKFTDELSDKNVQTSFRYSPSPDDQQTKQKNAQKADNNQENLDFQFENLSESETEVLDDPIFDVFNKPCLKCEICTKFVRITQIQTHRQECVLGQPSKFGLATLRGPPPLPKKAAKTQESKPKAVKAEPSLLPKNLAQVTLATNLKKIKTDLQLFGFNQALINTLQKPKLVQIYNKFITKFTAYNDYSDSDGLRIMICDEICSELGQNKADNQQYYDKFEEMLKQMLKDQSQQTLLKMREYAGKMVERRNAGYIDIE
ncbi:C3HC4 type (RING finger) domain-containing protein [Hexamita inflata]|uniref:C3HC4 type (RING finger) domain-containing protein n=1 Tax=Hexamita inflata TaxID=28002 RepID=A0AA86UPU7_9EUKA|nr:C3HC4 type (RING finger) domain-containing protein [Hexamita inflata]